MHTIALTLLILSTADNLILFKTENRILTEGEIFELKCSTSLPFPIVWHFRNSDGIREIFMGGEISKPFKDMFLLTGNQSLGEYNLYISSADNRYAGNYKCIDDEGLGSDLRSFQLNVIASTTTIPLHVPPIAEHALDATNYEAPKAAAISLLDPVQPNSSVIIVGAVCGLCVLVVGIVVAVVIVRRNRRSNIIGEGASCPERPEAQFMNSDENPKPCMKASDSSASPELIKDTDLSASHVPDKESAVESNVEKSTSLQSRRQQYTNRSASSDSDSSTSMFIQAGKEEH